MTLAPKANMAKSNAKLVIFLLITITLLLPFLAFWIFPAVRHLMASLWFHSALHLAGLTLRVDGTPATDHPVLFTANHVSYLDIPVIAALAEGCFVAKQEVASWPLFGFLAKLSRTVFIRRATMQAMNERQAMSLRLSRDNLILFPEGTSSNGVTVRPFKSALFSVVRHGPFSGPVKVQPVSIAYTKARDGTVLIGARRDDYTWHSDMTLLPHLRRVFGLDGAEVRVIFHQPVLSDHFETRKDLARYCHERVLAGVLQAQAEALDESVSSNSVADGSLDKPPIAA